MGKKITQLATITEVADDDLIVGVDVSDTSGSENGTNKKFTKATLLGGLAPLNPQLTGWIPAGETWTRTGNHTFTVATDLTAKYRKGAFVRYKDGGAYEYGVIGSSSYSSPNTTVTLITNTSYTMAAATITDTAISYSPTPEGFPASFAYTPTWSGGSPSIGSGTLSGRWKTSGNICYVDILMVMAADTNYGTQEWAWATPVTLLYLTGGNCNALDSGTAYYIGGLRLSNSNIAVTGNNVGTAFKSNSPHTWATNDTLRISFSYIF